MERQSIIAYGEALAATTAETPSPRGSEVLVRISHCGVCHSDIHIHDGHFDLGDGKKLDVTANRSLPFTLGHEIAGSVEAVGEDVKQAEVGARVAVYPWIGCGSCERCDVGDTHLCRVTRHLGIDVDGGYASHVLVPDERYLIDISGIDPQIAGSLMCSGITAFSALKKAKALARGGPMMLVGLGGVGIMGLKLASALLDVPIAVAETDAEKRKAALAEGADHVFDPSDPGARKAVFKTIGAVDAAIDFVGSDKSLNFAQSILAKDGGVVVSGLMGGKFTTPVAMFAIRPFSIHGTFVGSLNDARELVELVRDGKINPIPVTTRPLGEANSALNDLRKGTVIGRVVLTP